jgi:hypothetical protein
MSHHITCLLVLLLCMTPSNAIALASPEKIRPPSPALIYSPKNADILIFQGIIEKAGSGGTALRTATSVYPLLGGDFAMIVGERVKVIGTVVREEEAKIVVARVQFHRADRLLQERRDRNAKQ